MKINPTKRWTYRIHLLFSFQLTNICIAFVYNVLRLFVCLCVCMCCVVRNSLFQCCCVFQPIFFFFSFHSLFFVIRLDSSFHFHNPQNTENKYNKWITASFLWITIYSFSSSLTRLIFSSNTERNKNGLHEVRQ